jgi:hypothetical protein
MTYPDLAKYFENADFTDVKVFEGTISLREFIASVVRRLVEFQPGP